MASVSTAGHTAQPTMHVSVGSRGSVLCSVHICELPEGC